MDKDAYYFPHFSNARHDRKLRRVRKELGIEGYGIYFMVLEVLRDQDDFSYPMEDIDLLADEFGTSEQKVRVVICNYSLFMVTENEFFYSPKLIEYLSPYLEQKKRNRVNGIKGNLIKYGYASKSQLEGMTPDQILSLNANKYVLSGGDRNPDHIGDRKESKVNQSKENKIKQNERERSKIPTLPQVSSYFLEKDSNSDEAEKFYDYYQALGWKTKGGTPINDWKALIRNWLRRDKEKIQKSKTFTYKEMLNKVDGSHLTTDDFEMTGKDQWKIK